MKMGGTGNYSGYGSISTRPPVASSVNGAEQSQREIEINEFLELLLKEINGRDVGAISTHLAEIEKALGKEIDGIEKILFGGSISKSTFIEGTSDVDALVILDSNIYSMKKPGELQDAFVTILRARFTRTEIVKGNLAVTVKFSDYDVQLLPTLRDGRMVRIADRSKDAWSSSIDIKQFTTKLTAINKMNANKVIPVIKLAKKLFSNLPDRYQLSGYHVEAMAAEIFSTYSGRNTLYDMTKYFLDTSVKRVLRPISDITGQSHLIDSDLGSTNSIQRQKISYQIKEIAGRFSAGNSVSVTKELFGGDNHR